MAKKSIKKKIINKKNKFVTKNTYQLMFGSNSPSPKANTKGGMRVGSGGCINGVKVI
tara:strand:- start:427 stop:597 length:171 start_codon:yes stop_codon:yes gene_type:complete